MAEFQVRANTSGAEQDIDKLIAKLTSLGKSAGLTQSEIDKIAASTRKAKTEGAQNFDSLGKSMGSVNDIAKKGAEIIGAYFAIDKIKDFVGEVVRVTAEFQRLEAVLTNTLGSNSAARAALADIQKLAAVTPFSVRELSDSFIKLANRGVKPTMDEMRKMGDLAATLGKPFEQVVEALLDINNQERWKEIGVKAETAGNKVRLSFKGATYEVDRTVQGVTDAAVKLGELEGVAGSMNAISKTLGGQISNLGDAWETFLKTVGDGNNGVLSGFVGVMNDILASMTAVVKTAKQYQSEKVSGQYTNSKEYIDTLVGGGMSSDKAGAIEQANIERRIQEKNDELKKLTDDYNQKLADGQRAFRLDDEKKKIDAIQQEIKDYQEIYTAVQNYTDSLHKEHDLKLQQDADKVKKQAELDEIQRMKDLKEWLDKINYALDWNAKHAKPVKGIPTYSEVQNAPVSVSGKPTDKIDGVGPNLQDAPDGSSVLGDLDAKGAALKEFKNLSIETMGQIFAYNLNGIQNEMTALTQRYNYELGLAGTNKDAQKKLQNDYNKQMLALQNKQAQAQKEQAIFGILVNQGPAIAKAIATAGFPLNLGIGLVVAAMFSAILGQTKSIATPRFKDGVFGLEGPGTDTSDSIPAFLSRDESVVAARKSRKFKDVLQPMIENENFAWADLRRIVDAKMPVLNAPLIFTAPHVRDDGKLLDRLERIESAVRNKKEFHWNITEDGLSMLTREKDQWTRYVNKRYKGKG
jgi:hypothetical protein